MNRKFRRKIFFALAGLMLVPAWCGSVQLSMRDTSFLASDTLHVSIYADSIPAVSGLLSYQLTLSFDPQVLIAVGANSLSTLTEPFGDPYSSDGTIPGELRVATAGTHPVSGTGVLVTVLLRAATTTGGACNLRLDSILLNEGSPEATYNDPLAHIVVLGTSKVPPLRSENTVAAIAVAPNPAREFITLSFPLSIRVSKVRVWNILGREVMSVSFAGNRLVMPIQGLSNGTYILTAEGIPHWSSRFVVIQ
jgi:hypothetical protein